MITIEYAFAVACVICIACMVIIELKPKCSQAFAKAFNIALTLSLAVLARIMGYSAWDALRG